MNEEVLISGKTSFKIEVPYKLIEVGESGEKPLIVYLHGFNQNIAQFRELVDDLLSVEAYHLFIQAPYPIYDRRRKKRVRDWGRAWYLYDGNQQQFMASLEQASEFVQELVDNILEQISPTRLAVFGYSMGGYLAGYFALSRWKHVNDLVVIGGRIKTEVFKDRKGKYDHMNVLALHGAADESVESKPQKESCKQLSGWGARVTFREVEGAHTLDNNFIKEAKQWFSTLGYRKS